MNTEKLIWSVLILIGALLIVVNTATRGAGKAYVKAIPKHVVNVGTADEPEWISAMSSDALDYDLAAIPDEPAYQLRWELFEQSTPGEYATAMAANKDQTEYRFSISRTAGIWAAALFTLFIFSFLYKDNPFYKIAESVVVGVSAAYWMVVGWWDMIVPNLFGKLVPGLVKAWAIPGLDLDDSKFEWPYLVPLALGIMLLWRLMPKGGWIARWPMAFIIGVFCGLRLITFIHADFLSQIRNSIVTLWVVTGGEFDFWASLKNGILLVGVLTCLVYFFFSIEHKGAVGHTARVGIWFLMVTFGAAFGYTVMGRIALLAIRLEFLFDDWLWIIDPTGKRAVAETVASLLPGGAFAFG